MRVLWVCRRSSDEGAGDSLYDDKLVAGLRTRCDVEVYGLARNPRLKQLTNAARNFSLPEQYGVGSDTDIARLRDMVAQGFNAAIFSHEHVDAIARAVRPAASIPFIAVRQNVTSDAMASILRGVPPIAGVYRALAEAQEKAALRELYQEITAISVADQYLLRRLSGRDDITLIPPGAPPASALSETAHLRRDLVISGTYDWFPKARDLRRFAADYAKAPVGGAKLRCASAAAPIIRSAVGSAHDDGFDPSDAIRFGVITDRFTAGHKLKTAAYLVSNCAVISFARVSPDFVDLPFYRNWIFEIDHVDEIGPIMDRLAKRPAEELRGELTALKAAIAQKFNWRAMSAKLADLIERSAPQVD